VANSITAPEALRCLHQWLLWRAEERGGKLTKVPYQANGQRGSSTDPSTQVSFDEALAALNDPRGTFSGIGVAVFEENGLVGIDQDQCVDPQTGAIDPWAQDIVNRINSYTEISPSGTGLRIFIFAKLPPEGRKRDHFECYSSGRYLTITGNVVPGTPSTVNQRQAEMDAVHQEIFGEWLAKRTSPADTVIPAPLGLDDTEILERAFASKTGAAFQVLYRGNTDAYPSTSEADFALVCRILFWTTGDLVQADRLFRSSGLMREKWDERHGALTYGELTLTNALRGVTEFYSPKAKPGETGAADSAWLSIEEIDALLGLDRPEAIPLKQTQRDPNVADTVSTPKSLYTVSTTLLAKPPSHRARQESRWSDAVTSFPYPKGVKPLVKSTVLYSGSARQMAVVDLLSNSYHNPINSQFKKRKIHFNVLPKLEGGPVYSMKIPVEEHSKKVHGALKKQFERAEAEWLHFDTGEIDNGVRHGYSLYLANVQMEGWELVPDVKSTLVGALHGIAPSQNGEVARFRPYSGSKGWAGNAMKPPEEDQDKWHVIAQAELPTDWVQVEAELIASGIYYEQVPEYWKRSQWGPGIVADFDTEQEALDFAVSIGYAPTANSLEVAATV